MKTFLQNNEATMFDLLEKLVNIDSGTYHKAGVDEVGHILIQAYQDIGFDVKVHEQQDNGNHYVLSHKNAVEPNIIISAHMDTVFEQGTVAKRPFSIKGDYAFGPGVIDMKASLVSVLYSMKTLIESGSKAYQNVQIILNGDEEVGSLTSRHLIEQYAKNKSYALVMEPARNNGDLVTGRRGSYRYTLSVEGEAAHSGIEPEKGRSAIEDLAEKVIKLHALTDYEAGVNVNVGVISGGTTANTIASEATAKVDARMRTMKQAAVIKENIEAICAQPDVPGTSTVAEGVLSRPPMVKDAHIQKLFDTIQAEGKQIGLLIKDTATGGGSDASFISTLGIPTVDGMGPIGGNQHTEDEYLEVSSLLERTHLLARTIDRLSDELKKQ